MYCSQIWLWLKMDSLHLCNDVCVCAFTLWRRWECVQQTLGHGQGRGSLLETSLWTSCATILPSSTFLLSACPLWMWTRPPSTTTFLQQTLTLWWALWPDSYLIVWSIVTIADFFIYLFYNFISTGSFPPNFAQNKNNYCYISKWTWCLMSTETMRLIRDRHIVTYYWLLLYSTFLLSWADSLRSSCVRLILNEWLYPFGCEWVIVSIYSMF